MPTPPCRPARTATLAALGVAVLTGCTTSWIVCDETTCTAELSGEQTVDLDFGAFERQVDVEAIGEDSVVVATGGERAGLTVGQNASIGGVQVRLEELHGDALTLRVTRGG